MDFDRTYADYVDQSGVAEIQKLETEIGRTVLAYYTPPVASDLPREQLDKIRALEKKLCVRLVAYDTH